MPDKKNGKKQTSHFMSTTILYHLKCIFKPFVPVQAFALKCKISIKKFVFCGPKFWKPAQLSFKIYLGIPILPRSTDLKLDCDLSVLMRTTSWFECSSYLLSIVLIKERLYLGIKNNITKMDLDQKQI